MYIKNAQVQLVSVAKLVHLIPSLSIMFVLKMSAYYVCAMYTPDYFDDGNIVNPE